MVSEQVLTIGVWYVSHLPIDLRLMLPCRDTVSAVGLIGDSSLFADKNNVLFFCHALSLDEHQIKFGPFFYTGDMKRHNRGAAMGGEPGSSSRGKWQVDSLDDQGTDFDEVLFAGTHCGVFQSNCVPRPMVHTHPFRC